MLDIILKGNITVFLLGDFNINFLKYEKHNPTNEFLDSLLSNVFLPYISHPTRIHVQSRTLIGNIFCDHYNREAISGNLTSTISNRLPQFLFVPSIFSDPPSSKSNMYERNWSKFNKEDFMLNYFEKDLEGMLNLSRNDIDLSFNNFLMNMNELLNMHVPYRKLNKYKLKT